jgi:hypothetical protein
MSNRSPSAADRSAAAAALPRLLEQECERYLLIDDTQDDAGDILVILRNGGGLEVEM